jgi:hypothetical protein
MQMNFGLFQRFLILRACVVCLICGAVLAGSVAGLHAKPLDKKTCKVLVTEKKSLTARGVAKQMAKGPLWAKENLTSAQLTQIKRYITVDEQLKFRCQKALKVHAKKKSEKKKTASGDKNQAATSKTKAAATSASAGKGTASKSKSSASAQ